MLSAADLRCFRLTRAAEKAVSRQNGVVHTTLLGETAYAPSIDYWQRLVAELPQSVSHTRCLAASPSGPGCAATQRAVEPSSAHLCVAGPDVVYRRLHSRVLRDGSGLVCRLLSVSQTSGHHLSWLSQSLDRRAGTCPAGPGCGRASPHFHALRRPLALSRLSSLRLRWLAHGMSAHCRIGATHGKGRQRRFGAHAVADGHRPSPLRLAVGVAPWAKAPPANRCI